MPDHAQNLPDSLSVPLRRRLTLGSPILVGGAHDAISARLVEQAGFDAIWLSGFGVSAAQRAIPDANLVTMSEMLTIARNIVGAVDLPLIVDGDNGYGDLNNAVFAVEEFERAGATGLCIEDNAFPKRNSFYQGVMRSLLPAEEMAAKIRAAKQAAHNPDFLFIARTEALIAGGTVEEALSRATLYREAGADALLVHARTWPPIQAFLGRWRGAIPIVIVPTMFLSSVSRREMAESGVGMIIYANQALRAAVSAMRRILSALRDDDYSTGVEKQLVTMDEINCLVGFERLQAAERSAAELRN